MNFWGGPIHAAAASGNAADLKSLLASGTEVE